MVSLGYGFKSYVGCRIKQVIKIEIFFILGLKHVAMPSKGNVMIK